MKNDELIPVVISTDHSESVILPRNIPIAIIDPINKESIINSLFTCDNFDDELKLAKIFHDDRKAKFNITKSTMPQIAEIGPLSATQRSQLDAIILSNNLSFTHDALDLGRVHCFKFRIELRDPDKIAYVPPRILAPGIREDANQEFLNWKKRGMVEESSSQFNSPLIVIKKGESKSTRLVIDSRQVNQNTKIEKTPIPHSQSILYNLGAKIKSESNFFLSRLDLSKAYNQLPIYESDRGYSAFSFQGRSWQPTRVCYGFSAAPASWHRLMQNIFNGLPVEIFFDDIVWCTSTFEEHLKILNELLTRCIKFGLLIDEKKCHFCV